MFSCDTLILYDTEWTTWPGFWESNWSLPGKWCEIAQIGAVKLSANDGYSEMDSFQVLVIPKRNPLLSDYFIDLTGITQERVDREGIPFPRALEGFLSFAGNGPAEYSCYGGDADKIRRNCDIHGIPFPSAIRHSVDIRRNLIDRGLTKPEWFSSDLTLKLGLQKEGVSHDALCDARTVASALRYFRQQGLV